MNQLDLTFATRFVVVYLSIKVKGSQPMIYQYLMVDLEQQRRTGFIDKKKFKMASKMDLTY